MLNFIRSTQNTKLLTGIAFGIIALFMFRFTYAFYLVSNTIGGLELVLGTLLHVLPFFVPFLKPFGTAGRILTFSFLILTIRAVYRFSLGHLFVPAGGLYIDEFEIVLIGLSGIYVIVKLMTSSVKALFGRH